MTSPLHIPVLCDAVVHAMHLDPQGTYVDATYGRGGHSRAILGQLGAQGRLWLVDRDPHAIEHARVHFGHDPRVRIHLGSFSEIPGMLSGTEIDGIVFDLGVASTQLDEGERGFSFRHEGPLDMRFNPMEGAPVSDWLNRASCQEIADVIYHYGEETRARAIARAIVAQRQEAPIVSTAALASLVASVVRSPKGIHPATKTFQALRMYVNDELGHIERALLGIGASLRVGGRLLVLTFHGLETRMVKSLLRGLPLLALGQAPAERYRRVGRDKASFWERRENPRARSAHLFILEKQ